MIDYYCERQYPCYKGGLRLSEGYIGELSYYRCWEGSAPGALGFASLVWGLGVGFQGLRLQERLG